MASYVDKLLEGVDCYDVNTIPGLINRLNRFIAEKSKNLMSEKYILDESVDPISYQFYKKQESQFWTNAEMTKFSFDREDYKRANPKIKHGINKVLSFFATGDGLVMTNLAFRFIFEAENSVEITALMFQAIQESVHAENYNLALNIIVPDDEERLKLKQEVDKSSIVQQKAVLVEKYMNANLPLAYRLIAFASTEGIFFWSSFTFLFWFRQQIDEHNKMPFEGLVESNIQISRDESLHRDFGVARYSNLPVDQRFGSENCPQYYRRVCRN